MVRELREQLHDTREDGDVELMSIVKFVSLSQAVAAARDFMPVDTWNKPFNHNRHLDIFGADRGGVVTALDGGLQFLRRNGLGRGWCCNSLELVNVVQIR